MKLTSITLQISDGNISGGSLTFYDYTKHTALSVQMQSTSLEEFNRIVARDIYSHLDDTINSLHDSKASLLAYTPGEAS